MKIVNSGASRLRLHQALLHEGYMVGLGLKRPTGFVV